MKFNSGQNNTLPPRFQPFVTVAVVVESQGKFLLVEEIPRDLTTVTFNQPAGHLEQHETLLEGAERELFIRFTFKASLPTPVPISPKDPQIIAGHWLTLAQIKNLTNLRSPIVSQCIDDYIKNGTSDANTILSS